MPVAVLHRFLTVSPTHEGFSNLSPLPRRAMYCLRLPYTTC